LQVCGAGGQRLDCAACSEPGKNPPDCRDGEGNPSRLSTTAILRFPHRG
jgi:hypothetical protein